MSEIYFLDDLLAFALGYLAGVLACRHHHAHTKLNLTIEGTAMSLNVGQTATAKIAPTAAGQPATVTNVVYGCNPTGSYTIVPASDGMSAVYTAAVVGTGITAHVAATNSAGTVLSESAALPDVVSSTLVADALNLTVTTP